MKSSFLSKALAEISRRRSAVPFRFMVSRRCQQDVLQSLASTMRRFSRSWGSAQARSTDCAQVAPSQRQRNAPHDFEGRVLRNAETLGTGAEAMTPAQGGTLWRIASTRMPTRWGMFEAIGFEHEVSNGTLRIETAVALIMGNVTEGVPLLRIQSQCFTGEMLGSLRCDCRDQLELSMQAIAEEGRGLLIYEHQECRGIGLMAKLEAYELQD